MNQSSKLRTQKIDLYEHLISMLVQNPTTVDAGQLVQVMVPVKHAQQSQARCVVLLPQPQCTTHRRLHDLAPGKGFYCAAAALACWPDGTAADDQPLAEELQHQTSPTLGTQKVGQIEGGDR